MLKGVAIFMMLFLHLFNSPNLLDSCHPLFFIGDVPIVSILTRVCKPVEFFLMLSGYGLYYNTRIIEIWVGKHKVKDCYVFISLIG